jgi:hypothetical protein
LLTPIPADLMTGSYELRLFTNDSTTRLATSNAFVIGNVPRVTATVAAIGSGAALAVSWAGIVTPTATDWIGLIPVNAPDASYVAWSHTTGTAAGDLNLPIPLGVTPGLYELRLFRQDTYQRLAVSNVVKVGPTVGVSPVVIAPGGTVTATWGGVVTPSATDWLALVPLNGGNTTYVAWTYSGGGSAGSAILVLPANLQAGAYDVRLFANDTLERLALSNVVTVTAPGPTLAVSPVTVPATGTLTVNWRGIAAPTSTDWIGMYAIGAADNAYITRLFTSGLATGTTPFALPQGTGAGSYELRLFANNTLTRLTTSNGFVVGSQ